LTLILGLDLLENFLHPCHESLDGLGRGTGHIEAIIAFDHADARTCTKQGMIPKPFPLASGCDLEHWRW
jgi:hypothetical protein